ncbi:MAG: pseudouridine-5-phosphate glycosidase [delta proteobacterium ML8_F1]|nr:MAG: pseudouridine-5-phosphate glycosidase [delta proteobacterium ML8_F1]
MLMEKMQIHPEVKKALDEGRPVVALESTIISHGMPYPENIETALALEGIIRENGATPATIAIIDGIIRIGLTPEQMTYMATAKDILKVSRRDLPEVLGLGKSGATTVAGTMILADLAGIRVFATGGIGGVHRGYDKILDISQDLEELSRTNVAVVCAGVKSILDIRSTLEYLETKSVPVYVYGSREFPAFYSRKSGISWEFSVDDLKDMAVILKTKWELGFEGGVVLANPIPPESELDFERMNNIIIEALKKAEGLGIEGKAMTPFLLDEIKSITKGESLTANIALVENNALVATRLAVALAEEQKK